MGRLSLKFVRAGLTFIVKEQKAFAEDILPKYFRKCASVVGELIADRRMLRAQQLQQLCATAEFVWLHQAAARCGRKDPRGVVRLQAHAVHSG